MDVHEAANIFPLDEASIPELAEDIRAHGLLESIKLCGGKIIDGRRRFRACELAGVEPQFAEVDPADPIAYSWSLNGPRRHLTVGQKAMAGARMRRQYEEEAAARLAEAQKRGGETGGRGRPKDSSVVPATPSNPNAGKTRAVIGKVVGVGGTSIDNATKVLREAVPEVVEAVDAGRMKVKVAAALASQPEEIQREAARPKRRGRPPNAERVTDPGTADGKFKGVGVIHAHEAINSLTRIPKNDALRKRGFQLVTDWIRHNK